MAFVRVVKNKAYYKRFQTKYRRRREGKTDYYARKGLIIQDKDKYNTNKYRFVVRKTNQRIISQIIYSTLKGDKVLCSADSYELRRFGLTAGLSSYPAAYLTGQLLGRRLLKQLNMTEFYKGVDKITGEKYDVSEKPDERRRPFKAIFDVGILMTTTGAKIFGALKGATDAGLYIPHNEKRFPGYKAGKDDKKEKYDPKVHRDRIFGAHIDKYIKYLKEKGQDAYKRQFSQWDKCLGGKTVEALVTKVLDDIKKNPDRVKRGEKKDFKREHKKFHQVPLTLKQRKDNIKKKFEIALKEKSKAAGKGKK